MGEGGLLVKVKRGKGLAHLDGIAGDARLVLKSVTVGANIGGSSEWGVGLVLGLAHPNGFGGDYSGTAIAATIADASTTTTELHSKNAYAPHNIYLVGSATGAAADAGGSSLTIQVIR
jgi:hypothetical protein